MTSSEITIHSTLLSLIAINMKHFFLLLSTLYILHSTCLSQDIHFSQFTQMPLSVNPAQAGTTAWIRAVTDYRQQWRSITIPYRTISVSFDQKIKKKWQKNGEKKTVFFKKVTETGLGWGVDLFNDKAGTSKMGTTQANLSLAYQVKTSDKTMLAAGMQGGFAQRSIRYDQLKSGSQFNGNNYDPNLPAQEDFSNSNVTYPDFGAGLLWSYRRNEHYMRGNDQKDIFIGASLFHLSQPTYSFFGTDEKLHRKLIVHGQSLIGIKNTNYSFSPSFLYTQQGTAKEIVVGSLIRYMLKEDSRYTGYVKGAALSMGGYYRNKDAFILAGIFEMSSYAIGISYDINVSGLRTMSAGRGGFEITLRFLNPSPFLYKSSARFE